MITMSDDLYAEGYKYLQEQAAKWQIDTPRLDRIMYDRLPVDLATIPLAALLHLDNIIYAATDFRSGTATISIAEQMLQQPHIIFDMVLPHEFAHVLASARNDGRDMQHGPEWVRALNDMGYTEQELTGEIPGVKY